MFIKNVLLIGYLILLLGGTSAFAQNTSIQDLQKDAQKSVKINDTSHKVWRTGGIFSLNVGQTAQSHWAAGGDNASLSLNALFNGYAAYNKGKNSWNNLLDMGYGYTKTTSTGMRKNDDHFYLTSQYGRQATENKKWYYSALFDFKTQFAKGYLYNSDGTSTFHSDIFSPAYVLLSIGMDYKPVSYFDVFLSPITERWTIISNDSLALKQIYAPTTSHVYNELGAFLNANFNKDLTKTIHYTSQLQLFSNYKHNPQNIAVYWTNLLTMKVSKYLATTVALNMIYDDNVKFPTSYGTQVAHLQLQEILGVGFSYKF
ncbi:MAG: DUF3078 domain-containing protein [Chitinophagaceae bacterium]